MNCRVALVALTGAMITFFSTTEAPAYSSQPAIFCNHSPLTMNIASGSYSPGTSDPADHSILTGPFVSEGWWAVDPGACQSLPNRFNARYIFWFGFTPHPSPAGGFNSGTTAIIFQRNPDLPDHFCVPNYFHTGKIHTFTFEDENQSVAACDRAGGSTEDTLWINPRKIDTWVEPTLNFTGQ